MTNLNLNMPLFIQIDPGPKTKARYWSCFQWRGGAKVDN